MREHRFKRLNQANRRYQIYALIDPRDNAIHYIGMSDDAEYRFYQYSLNRKVSERQKRWFKELQRLGLSAIPQILETVVPNTLDAARSREEYWIQEMQARVTLLSIFTESLEIILNEMPSLEEAS
jgi:GIY-YIG catalytic domain